MRLPSCVCYHVLLIWRIHKSWMYVYLFVVSIYFDSTLTYLGHQTHDIVLSTTQRLESRNHRGSWYSLSRRVLVESLCLVSLSDSRHAIKQTRRYNFWSSSCGHTSGWFLCWKSCLLQCTRHHHLAAMSSVSQPERCAEVKLHVTVIATRLSVANQKWTFSLLQNLPVLVLFLSGSAERLDQTQITGNFWRFVNWDWWRDTWPRQKWQSRRKETGCWFPGQFSVRSSGAWLLQVSRLIATSAALGIHTGVTFRLRLTEAPKWCKIEVCKSETFRPMHNTGPCTYFCERKSPCDAELNPEAVLSDSSSLILCSSPPSHVFLFEKMGTAQLLGSSGLTLAPNLSLDVTGARTGWLQPKLSLKMLVRVRVLVSFERFTHNLDFRIFISES